MAEVKCVILGGGAVGKSALTISFVHHHFVELYDPTIEDSYRRTLVLDNELCVFDILDTAGQEDYGVLRDGYIRTGEGFVIVYDVTNRASFEETEMFYRRICMVRECTNLPLVLVGNKADLPRAVSSQEGAALAASWGAVFIEASAKTCVNVDESFHAIIRQVRKHRGTYVDPSAPKKSQTRKNSRCRLL
jgi:GTPase KRas protein